MVNCYNWKDFSRELFQIIKERAFSQNNFVQYEQITLENNGGS